MWLWWILSLVVLVLCLVFAIRIFTTSRNLHRQVFADDKDDFPPLKFPKRSFLRSDPQEQAILLLRTRLQQVMSNSDKYLEQLNKLTDRLEALESGKRLPVAKKADTDDDWEEMYYEEQAKKEKLENELDVTQQLVEKNEEKLLALEQREQGYKQTLSEFEGQINNLNALEERIELLQRKLEGSKEREQELQQQLDQEHADIEQYRLMQKDHIRLQAEAEDLRRSLQELGNSNRLTEQKLHRLAELESTLDAAEYEKSDLRKKVEEIIMENETLSLKLQELQDKLGSENYA